MKLSTFIEFNPQEHLPKGTFAKKVPMDNLKPYTRRIQSFCNEQYGGGAKFCNGDTLLARITPCLENGKTAYVNFLADNEIAFGSTEYIVMRAKSNVSLPLFVYYLATSKIIREPAIKSMVGSSGRQRVQQAVLEELEIPNFSLSEQQHIVDILGSIDDKIENNERIINKLHKFLANLFRQKVVNTTHKLIPLKDLCSVITKGTTPTTLGKTFTEQGIYFVKAESLLETHIIDINRLAFIDIKTHEILKRSQIQENDILFSIAGTIGRFALMESRFLPANTNQAVAIIRTNKIQPSYIYATLLSGFLNENIFTKTVQAVQANFSLGMLGNLEIPIVSELSLLSCKFDRLCGRIQSLITENHSLNKLKKSYLIKFFD